MRRGVEKTKQEFVLNDAVHSDFADDVQVWVDYVMSSLWWGGTISNGSVSRLKNICKVKMPTQSVQKSGPKTLPGRGDCLKCRLKHKRPTNLFCRQGLHE